MFCLKSVHLPLYKPHRRDAVLWLLAAFVAFPTATTFAQLPAPAHSSKRIDIIIDPDNTNRNSGAPALPPAATTDAPPPPAPPATAPAPDKKPKPKPEPAPTAKPAELEPLSIGGVSIRGLSDLAVVKKIRTVHGAKLQSYVDLWDGRKAQRMRRADLGASIPYYKLLAEAREISDSGGNVPLRFEVDVQKATKAMKSLASRVNHGPSNASLDVDANGQVVLAGGEGTSMAIEGSALRVKAALENEPPQTYAELVVARQPGTSSLRQFKHLLAEYSTPYDAAIRGRTNNLVMSAKLVNGGIVQPGKIFSTNLAIGPRNAANGWKEAKMFVSGQVVNGVGAGICQTATTIYNAALLANLPIVERHPHSFRVNYAPASRDATIYWGHKDMKFRNNMSGPIYVQTFVKNSRFHVRLYGTQPVSAGVAVESRIISQTKGTRSEAYRVVQTSAGEKRHLLSRDYYKPKAG